MSQKLFLCASMLMSLRFAPASLELAGFFNFIANLCLAYGATLAFQWSMLDVTACQWWCFKAEAFPAFFFQFVVSVQ